MTDRIICCENKSVDQIRPTVYGFGVLTPENRMVDEVLMFAGLKSYFCNICQRSWVEIAGTLIEIKKPPL